MISPEISHQSVEGLKYLLALAPFISTVIITLAKGKFDFLKTKSTGRGYTEATILEGNTTIIIPTGASATATFIDEEVRRVMDIEDYRVNPEKGRLASAEVRVPSTGDIIKISPTRPEGISTNNNVKVLFVEN